MQQGRDTVSSITPVYPFTKTYLSRLQHLEVDSKRAIWHPLLLHPLIVQFCLSGIIALASFSVFTTTSFPGKAGGTLVISGSKANTNTKYT